MFIDFYREMMNNQSIVFKKDYYDNLYNLIDKLLLAKKAKMFYPQMLRVLQEISPYLDWIHLERIIYTELVTLT